MHSLAGLALIWVGGYALLKRLLAVCVGAMFVTVTLTAFLLAPDWAAVGRGLTPSLPPGGAGWIIGLIGAIGGTMALISYGYWIREEGRTGEEGLRACRFELVLSYTVIGLFGLAVVIIGSRTSVRGQGNELALLLADQLAANLGQSSKWIFLVGFWAAVFSALLGVWQSLPYCSPISCCCGKALEWLRWRRERRSDRDLTAAILACLATVPLFLLRWRVQELQLAFGLTGAMLLPLLALTLLIMNNRTAWVGDRLRASLALNLVLAAALAFFAFTAIREVMRLAG